MKITRLEMPNVVVCESLIFGNERGYFLESFGQDFLDYESLLS